MANLEIVTRWYSPNELKELENIAERGDLIECDRGLFKHWGVFAGLRYVSGDKQVSCVIHFAGALDDASTMLAVSRSDSNFGKTGIAIDRLADVVLESRVRINNGQDRSRSAGRMSDIMLRAELRVGKEDEQYSVVWNNCEHFATYCRYGQKNSCQVQSVVKEAAVGVGVAAAFGLVAAAVYTIFGSKEGSKRKSSRYEQVE